VPLLVTSASGDNGNGFGALLAFDADGRLRGPFLHDVRIADPRGLGGAGKPSSYRRFAGTGLTEVQLPASVASQRMGFILALAPAQLP
jgi:hypothetical protein